MGAGWVRLTYYHKKFLAHLISHEIAFLIIGGQARVHYYGGTTEDLDLWLQLLNGNDSNVHKAIVEWSAEFPWHTRFPIIEPFEIKPNTQIKFPDADVAIMNASGKTEDVPHSARIDILFGFDNLCFEEAFDASENAVFGTMNLKLVSREHLSVITMPTGTTG